MIERLHVARRFRVQEVMRRLKRERFLNLAPRRDRDVREGEDEEETIETIHGRRRSRRDAPRAACDGNEARFDRSSRHCAPVRVPVDARDARDAAMAAVMRAEEVARDDAPSLAEAVELCASTSKEKKLVGAYLAAQILQNAPQSEIAERDLDAIARALGSKFIDELLRPKSKGEDARMGTELGLRVCETLAKSARFARSATCAYWIDALSDAAMRKEGGIYEGVSDDGVASALAISLRHLTLSASARGGEVNIGKRLVEAAVEALKRTKGEIVGRLTAYALDVVDCALTRGERVEEDARVVARAAPEMCRVLRETAGDGAQLRALAALHSLFCGVLQREPELWETWDDEHPSWRQDLLEGLWVILSSRTPRVYRFVALDVARCMSDGTFASENIEVDANDEGGAVPWLYAAKATPPAAVLAGAVSAGSTKKVPSFMCLLTELVRVEVNVGLYALLNANDDDSKDEPLDPEKEALTFHGLTTALELFPCLIQGAADVAECEEAGRITLSEAMGCLSAGELMKIVETLADITSSILEVFEDTSDREKVDPLVCVKMIQCVSAHLIEAPELHQDRMEKLLTYWFGEFLDRCEGDTRYYAEARFGEHFLTFFGMVTTSSWGIELMWECGYVRVLKKFLEDVRPTDGPAHPLVEGIFAAVGSLRQNVDNSTEVLGDVKAPLLEALDELLRASPAPVVKSLTHMMAEASM